MPDTTSEPLVSVPPPVRIRKTGGARIMIVVLIVLVLTGIIVYLLSMLNSKKYYLVPEGGELAVKKGIFFPVGSERYQPPDSSQAELYSPIALPEELRHAEAIEFEDLPSLNREFANYLIGLATRMIFSEDEARYAMGKSYLERLGSLQGLDAKQVQSIQGLNADVDYIEAKRAYVGVEKTLEHALKKFKQAETFGTGRFEDVGEWIGKIQVLLEAIRLTKASGKVQPARSKYKPKPAHPTSKASPKAKEKTDPEPEQKSPRPSWRTPLPHQEEEEQI